MDFFLRQAEARVTSARVAGLMVPVVAALFAAVDVILYLFALLAGVLRPGDTPWEHLWTFQALLGTLILVGGGAALEWLHLRDGGRAVAEMLGARAVDFATRDAAERRFRHVAEEMAIASGVPAPLLYVLDGEPGINAFVAGYTPAQSVLVVTKGVLEHLDRDELQGIVGHEFSHILHGDMRLNMRLLTGLAGILALGQLGGFLMRSLTETGPKGEPVRNPVFPVWLLGALLWLAGWIGLGLGRLIKAVVSREREYLADAASVQFTRNPEGLASALWQVLHRGSALHNLHAEAMSHLCFSQTLPLARWFATHPPLEERIERVYPGYLVRRKHRPEPPPAPAPTETPPVREGFNPEDTFGFASVTGQFPALSLPTAADAWPDTPVPAVDLVGRVGELRPEDLQSARVLRRQLPVEVARALQTVTGARAVLFAVVTRRHPVGRDVLATFFRGQVSLAEWVYQLQEQLAALDVRFSLPLLELSLSRLAALDRGRLRELRQELERFVRLDREVSLFDFALLTLVSQHLAPRPAIIREVGLPAAAAEVSRLTAALLTQSSLPPASLPTWHADLLRPLFGGMPSWPAQPLDLTELERALRRCRRLEAPAKRTVLDLCARTVACDGQLHLREYELVRVIAQAIGCPLPLLQGVITT